MFFMPSDVTTEQRQEIHRAIDSGGIWRGRYRVQRRNGRTFPAAAVLAPIRDAEGVITGMTGVSRDISERLDAEQAIRRHAKQQSLIAAFSRTVLTLYNLDDLQDQTVAVIRDGLDVEYCEIALPNPDGNGWMLKAGLGWEHGWVGQSIFDGEAPTHYQEVLASGEPILVANFRNEQRFKSLEIHQAHGIVSAAAVPISGAGGVHGVLGALSHDPDRFTLEDIDFLQSLANTLEAALERKQAEDKLTQLAQFDVVTGLPNRSLFRDRLSQALAQVQRNGGLLGVLFVDLDGFKAVNDTLGHTAGDTLLDQVGQRLQYSVRSGDTVSRLAGDEFAILLTNLAKTEDAGKVAEKILAECARAFHVGGNQTFVSASIGVALHPGDGNDTDQLLKNADIAMYRAKEQGRNNYQFYLPQMHERALERMRLEAELRGALSRDEFVLHYQPKVDLHNGEICGFEALLRWQHPERGLVPPVKFISILEDTGLIVPVGEWVIRTVCAQILSWQELGMKIHPVAVNLSSRQFQHKNIDIVIRRILDSTGVNPRLLEFEVTESLLMQDAEEAVRMLHNMKSFGVRLSVDDFGTGYSSLAYLKRFPLDVLKIDRAFIRDCITDPDDATIVQAIISLAQNLKLKVVAEGVETEAQLHFLRALGCDHMQGYFFSKPVEIDAVNRMLAEDVRLQSKFVDNGAGERTVLLVDDNEYDLLLWRDAFAPLDCRILTAVSAELALDILANNAIDIVISDQNMPTMSGTRFLSTVRQFYPDAIRIMLTGDESNETLPNAVNEAGVHRFLSKHWSPERLLKEVRETCRQLSHLDPAQRVTQGFA
jgi:diguanylate cyclase (GGDEF)-like protein